MHSRDGVLNAVGKTEQCSVQHVLPGFNSHDSALHRTREVQMNYLKKRVFLLTAIIALSVVDLLAQSTPVLPPVIVTGTRIGGGTVICRGMSCAGVLADLQVQTSLILYDQGMPLGPDDDIPVDPGAMCNNLRQAKPAGCSLSNPPPSPGIGTNWQANGCGTGRLANLFADAFLEVASRPTYSGDLQAPFPGVSFRDACNGHDQCWAEGNARTTCDYAFRQNMISACGGDSPANNTCLGFSGLYHGAVSTTGAAQAAYNNSVSARACALWASDMRENGCQ